MPFEAIGDKAQWELIYEHLVTLEVGSVTTYDDLTRVLGKDFKSNRAVFGKALAALERDAQRTVINIRGVGYRIAHASEHLGLVKYDHRMTKRRMSRTIRRAESTDRGMLSVEDRNRIDRVEMTLRRQADFIRRLENRQTRIENTLKEARRMTSTEVAGVSAEVGALARALAEKLERAGFAEQATTEV